MLTRSKARKEIFSLGKFCLRHGQLLSQALLNVFGNELRWKEEDFLNAFTQRILGVVRPRKTDFMYLMLRRKDPEQNFRKLETPYRGGVNITINQDPLRARLKAFERLSKLPQVIEQAISEMVGIRSQETGRGPASFGDDSTRRGGLYSVQKDSKRYIERGALLLGMD